MEIAGRIGMFNYICHCCENGRWKPIMKDNDRVSIYCIHQNKLHIKKVNSFDYDELPNDNIILKEAMSPEDDSYYISRLRKNRKNKLVQINKYRNESESF
jgi:hypothetical protein